MQKRQTKASLHLIETAMDNEFTSAQSEIRKGVREWFMELRESHPDQHFYAFAFGFHDDFVGPSLWANSLEFLRSKCDPDDDEEFCWNPGQWEHSDSLDRAWQALSKYPANEKNEVDDEVLHYRARCLGVTMAGLRDLTDEGLWTRDPIPVLAFVSIWDSSEDRWVVWESIHRLNSPDILDRHPLRLRNWLGDKLFSSEPDPPTRRRWKQPSELAQKFYEMFGKYSP
jgi:hypothetical protein